jgi:hypothetical protein
MDLTSPAFRPEVQTFINASETLLSPALLSESLTSEECDVIAYYVTMLSSTKHPWAKTLTVRNA